MSRVQTVTLMMITALLALTGPAFAQGEITATLQPSGLIEVSDDAGILATIELNAHGPGWQHAPQDSVTGEVRALPDEDGAEVTGALAIPNTDGGALEFIETVRPLPQGLRLEYDVSVTQAMRLSGLQFTVNLPVARFGGDEVIIRQPTGDPKIAGLPAEQGDTWAQLWRGDGSTIEVAGDTDRAITVQLRAATDVVLQDLRQWDQESFEVRFPAIMEDPGREMSEDDRFHLDVTITFAGPLTLVMP